MALFIGQAFLYNAILFGYATLLSTFFGVSTNNAPYYLVAFAVGNLLGPIILGPLFDTVGRKPMIAGTYILSGVLLLITGYLFDQHSLSAGTLTLAWSVVFFFASAGVSAAYLTVSEIFPMETRALAIAIFYALGTGLGGIIGPQLFGRLIADRQDLGRVRGADPRLGADDPRRPGRDPLRGQGRAHAPGRHRQAAHRGGRRRPPHRGAGAHRGRRRRPRRRRGPRRLATSGRAQARARPARYRGPAPCSPSAPLPRPAARAPAPCTSPTATCRRPPSCPWPPRARSRRSSRATSRRSATRWSSATRFTSSSRPAPS